MRNLLIALSFVLFVVGYYVDAHAQTTTVVVPNGLANVVGNTDNGWPLNCGGVGNLNSQRYQQIYAAEQIGVLGYITAFSFRLSQFELGPFGPETLPNVQIDMSITPVEPENASNTFADNLGPVVTTVHQGDILIDIPMCTTAPCPFDVMVPLDIPLLYDPSEGNLIVDFRIPDCVSLGSFTFGADSLLPASVSTRIFTPELDGVDNPVGEVDSFKPITQFVIESSIRNVPTLSEWGLIAMASILGIVGFYVIRRRQAAV